MNKAILIFGLCFYFFNANAQDTIWLKSGKTLAGQIFSFADNIVRIKAGRDTSIYRLDEIKSLRYNGPVSENNTASPSKILTEKNSSKKQEDELK